MRVLVVEDEIPLLASIAQLFREEGYGVDEASSGDEGLSYAETGIYDLLVLDIMLPERNGLQVLQEVRKQSINTPTLLLTAKDSVEDKVRGLNTGADDYLVKPFAVPELLARVRALLRRNASPGGTSEGGVTQYEELRMETRIADGYYNETLLHLTTKEYELLLYLVRNREQIMTREHLFDRIWGLDSEVGLNLIDLYVHYVRKKLAAAGCEGWIVTIRGVGFMLRRK